MGYIDGCMSMELNSNLLFTAAQIVAESNGFTLDKSLKHYAKSQEEFLQAVPFCWREVKLDGKWWLTDCGNLLIFKKDGQPCALKFSKEKNYEYIDPENFESEKITKKNASEFSDKAFYFYRPFPHKLNFFELF